MERIYQILEEIEKEGHDKMSEKKHQVLASLWAEYYRLCKQSGRYPMKGEDLFYAEENTSFAILTDPPTQKYDKEILASALRKREELLEKKKVGFTEEEAEALLDWSVSHARETLTTLGIQIENASLRGLCEIGQALTLYPWMNSGFKTTINNAKLSFDFPGNHWFGTVKIPTIRKGRIMEVPHLLDITYRQFFTTIRCHEGMYDAIPEEGCSKATPDPGYFMTSDKDKAFAKKLIEVGHIELTKDAADEYAKGFRMSSLSKEEVGKDISIYDNRSLILDLTLRHIPLSEEELTNVNISTEFPSSQEIESFHLKK